MSAPIWYPAWFPRDFEVVSVSRGVRAPYQPHGARKSVRTVTLSREAEEQTGAFGPKIRDLRPDIVIDMICFTKRARDIWSRPCAVRRGISCTRNDLGTRP